MFRVTDESVKIQLRWENSGRPRPFLVVTPRGKNRKFYIEANIAMLGVSIGVFDTTESIPVVSFSL